MTWGQAERDRVTTGTGGRPGWLGLRLQQPHESFLLEMAVGGEGVGEAALAHEEKADGVAQGVRLVGRASSSAKAARQARSSIECIST